MSVITLIYENFFLCVIIYTFVTELGQEFLIFDLISFSGKVIKGKPVSLILLQNKLKFNVERDIYEKVLIF